VDKPPIFQYFDGGNPGERQQIIRIGLGSSIMVTVNEVTAHILAMEIDESKIIRRHGRHRDGAARDISMEESNEFR